MTILPGLFCRRPEACPERGHPLPDSRAILHGLNAAPAQEQVRNIGHSQASVCFISQKQGVAMLFVHMTDERARVVPDHERAWL